MPSMVVFGLVVGSVFGALTSLINDVSSPYGLGGSPMVTPALRGIAEFLSKFFGVGWSWRHWPWPQDGWHVPVNGR